jgi:hypothetical protein
MKRCERRDFRRSFHYFLFINYIQEGNLFPFQENFICSVFVFENLIMIGKERQLETNWNQFGRVVVGGVSLSGLHCWRRQRK